VRSFRCFAFLLGVWAAGALHGQVLVSLGASTGCGSLQGGQTCTLTARVTGAANLAVTWSFSPSVAGAVAGTGTAPDSTGLSTNTYKAPSFITVPQTVTATATSVADPSQAASVFIGLIPVTITVTVSPAAVSLSAGQSQAFSAAVSGTSQTGVTWSLGSPVGTIDPAKGVYTAPAPITASQKVTVIATSVSQPTASGSATVTLNPSAPITVTVSPSTVTLGPSQTQLFTASLVNSTNGVTWSISPQMGAIDSTGLYTAPPTVSSNGATVRVTAASVDDPTKTGTATITLQPAPTVTVTVSPATVSLSNGQTQQFSAAVTNAAPGVTWSISPQLGTIDPTGFYSAPALVSGSQTVTVTATLVADASKSGTAKITLSTVVDVGVGAPPSLVEQFVTAYYRNGFSFLVSLPPLGNVKKLGTTGYVQEFSDANKTSGVKLALATLSPTVNTTQPDGSVIEIAQLMGYIYPYYSTVGASTAGYPLMDSQNCPPFDPANACQYDFFDKSYALFAYANSLATGQDFAINGVFYTEWTNLGGISGPGRPVDVQTAITAFTTTAATVQTYANGAIYSVTSGVNKGKVFGVIEPMYDLYVSQNGAAGPLGLPTSDAFQASTGLFKQTFEGGSLQYTAGGGGPIVQLPVASVALTGAPAGGATMNLGQSLTLTATPSAASGVVLSDRPVSWSSTNGKVVSIAASGQSAVVTAVGGGAASVTASSEGITSTKVNITVIAPCCQVGAGAPASVVQAFQDAITRNRISVELPAQSPATRQGSGYVQMLQSSDQANPAVYMLAQSDQLGTAYLVTGAILAQYQSMGGPAGTLGYPISDPSAGGTQLFANGSALAGTPVRVVTGGILSKWALLGYETGAAGPPVSDAAAFATFGANSGATQNFKNGAIYAATAGARAGQAYFVTGLILARYNALEGAAGDYGMPISDEFVSSGLHQQNFEGGNFTYSAGDAAAVEHPAPKVPTVVVAPSSVTAGGQVRAAFLGFANNSTVKVSITGQPDFQVTTANGAYSWQMAIPLASKSAALAIHAADTNSPAAADGTLTVRGFADNRVTLAKIQGDNQTGLPGALLPLSLRISLTDSAGTPVVGAPIVFQPSTGAQLSVASAVTDATGQAETFVRLPGTEGVSAVTANAPSIAQAPVSFFVRAAASSLSNFPQLVMAGTATLGNGSATIGRKGALLTAVASILRYHQNRGELPAPNGTADPGALNTFLTAYCGYDAAKNAQLCDGYLSNPASGEQIVNLWRAAEFTGGVDVKAQSPSASAIADLLAQGYPALLSLGLSLNGAPSGGHFVVAIGMASDGSFVIQDPNLLFARANLNDYLNGFTAAGGTWTATLRGVVQFARRSPGGTRFMVAALSQPPDLMKGFTDSAQSAAGACGIALDLLDSVDSQGTGTGALTSRILVCDGLEPAYTIAVGTTGSYRAFVTDLAVGGSSQDISASAPATYKASRPKLALTLAPQDASFVADGVVNAATFTAGIAPGGIMTIFGTGLSGPGAATQAAMDGEAVQILAATPFQINAVVPADTTPGVHVLSVTSAYGSAQQPVDISAIAPAIFLLGEPPVGAVVNQDGTLNSPANPLPRGQVLILYATGLGTVTKQGQLWVTTTPVTVVLNGQELPAAFAGLAPGTAGEYQVNVVIPGATPPGVGVPITLKQGGILSNTVAVTIQ